MRAWRTPVSALVMETVALGTTAPLESLTVPEMCPPTPAELAIAKNSVRNGHRMKRQVREKAESTGRLLVETHYQLRRKRKLVENECQLVFCKSFVTLLSKLRKFPGFSGWREIAGAIVAEIGGRAERGVRARTHLV